MSLEFVPGQVEFKEENEEEKEVCRAKIHHPKFVTKRGTVIKHYANSHDHFTPRCIDDIFGFEPEETGSDMNHIPMHRDCHALKDYSTPARLRLLKRQQRGEYISLQEYIRRVRNKYDLVFAGKRPLHSALKKPTEV